jgi:3-methyl-2-oxobutanoate hydroxymethyltransferase
MYADTKKTSARPKLTVPGLRAMKGAERIVAITAYDASFARAIDAAALDVVLVGDSLGMVIQGRDSTLPVTVDDIAYHSACVSRGLSSTLLIADMPFQSFATPERALDAASIFLAEGGASMVKLEGAGHVCESIEFLAKREIPVCAHLGLTPQSVMRLGGYKVQGRDSETAKKLIADAKDIHSAGADCLVLECVPSGLAAEITKSIDIPTIGIGAGPQCDGQILVLHDMLGMNSGHRRPRFVKDFMQGNDSIHAALQAYAHAVRAGEFPSKDHSYE